MAIPVIYKGDDTDFNGGAPIALNIETAFDLSGCRIELSFLGCRREFSGLSGHTATLSVVFSAAETVKMPVGTHCASLRAYDSAGRVRTLTDSVRLRVTDSVDEAAGGSVDVGVGETVEELTPTDGLGAVKEVVNKLARLVGASCIAMALCGATSLNDMPGTNTIYTAAETDAKIVELAPQPGNYATVSNRAMSALQSHQSLQPSTNYTDAALAGFARTNKVLKAGPYIPTAGGTATNKVTVTTGGPVPMIPGWVRPWSSLEIGAISFGDYWGGWTFDSSGLHRHMRTPLGDVTLGGAFTFPADAYETGGELALRSDIPDTSGFATPEDVTAAIRKQSLGGIWDSQLAVWWTPIMQNGALRYVATTNVDLSAEGNQ